MRDKNYNKYMKRMLALTGSFLMICLLITSFFIPIAPGAGAKSPETVTVPSGRDASAYRLSEFEGKIAAFEADTEKPVYISTRRVSDLPESDRRALIEGIPANSRSELNKLLRDYCS